MRMKLFYDKTVHVTSFCWIRYNKMRKLKKVIP